MYCKNCGEAMNDYQVVCLKCGVEKGKALGSHMNVFAIPNSERESNPALKQNDGY